MSKTKYWCFDCRITKRDLYTPYRTGGRWDHPTDICNQCAQPMVRASNYPTPRKKNDRAWKKMKIKVRSEAIRLDNRLKEGNIYNVERFVNDEYGERFSWFSGQLSEYRYTDEHKNGYRGKGYDYNDRLLYDMHVYYDNGATKHILNDGHNLWE